MQIVVVAFAAAAILCYVIRLAFIHGRRSQQMPSGEPFEHDQA